MKKYISVFVIMVMIFLAACSNQDTPPDYGINANDTNSESITMLDEGVWPANEYTQGLPVPPGKVLWAALDTKRKNCSISITDISENSYNGYIELLKQEGYRAVEEVSEEIKGQEYVSIGTLLSDGEKWLSVSYIPDNFTIYISFDHEEGMIQ